METNSAFFRHWDDVVFENRNKSYGAYLLRREYAGHLLSGVAVTMILVALLLTLQRIYAGDVPVKPVPPITHPGPDILPPPIVERIQKVVQDRRRPSGNTSRAILVTREQVVETEVVEDIREYVSGDDTGPGDFGGLPDGVGTIPVGDPAPVVAPRVLDIAEIMPHYEGGLEAMMKFIQKRVRYPRSARQAEVEGTVYVRFVVNGDGSVSDVEVIKGIHPDCNEEAMRVIAMLPSWKGGSHNGHPVSVRMVLPIRFNLN